MGTSICRSRGAEFLRRFRPCVVNYGVHFRRSVSSGQYFLSPHPGYSKQWGTPPYGLAPEELSAWGGTYFIGTETQCADRLHHDLDLLAGAGFNALRVVGVEPLIDQNGIAYPITPKSEASQATYLDLLAKLLAAISSHGLKAILLIGRGPQWHYRAIHHQFLTDLCTSIGDHPGVLAYDLYNEPAWLYPWSPDINKLATAHWIAESYWTIRRASPNQLVTIGLTHPDAVQVWDPSLIPVDFVSYHFYAPPPAVGSMDRLAALLYWAGRTSVRPWIIGETSLAGSDEVVDDPVVASEAEQKAFADFMLKRSLDCGAYGYSWWQYQEVDWGDASNRMGLITRLDDANPQNSDRRKPAFFSFASYPGALPEPANAVKPALYPNFDNHPATVLQGQCIDDAGQPVEDATVRAQRQQESVAYWTFSATNGAFEVKGPASSQVIDWGSASKPGYSWADAAASPNPCVLEPWRDDTWSRRWVATAPGRIDHSSGAWMLDPADQFYIGDFDGDGSEEILCTRTNGNDIALLRFDGHWKLVWSNDADPNAGNGIHPYRSNMIAGDFDDDGADELLGIAANGDWLTLFKYQNGNWQWIASTSGNTQHALKPYASRLIAGNFNGSDADLLLGIASWTTLFRFDVGTHDWVWVDSDYGKTNDPSHPLSTVRPYAGSVLVGDFNRDGRDEILGFAGTDAGSWVTLFSNSFQWMISNYGSREAFLSSITPYQSRLIAGDFDGEADLVLALSEHAALFAFASEEFEHVWGSTRTKLAGLKVDPTDKVLPIKCQKSLPDYLLVIPDTSRKASLIAFDPVPRR